MSLPTNTLYYGDCLEWLPHFPSESVDLIYLDPPFNSNQSYNLLFGNGQPKPNGSRSAQVRAFDDMWRWDDTAAERVDQLSRASAHPTQKAIVGLCVMLGESGMLAYLSYMAERLAEMPRVLKSTGSIYLHCDPAASHGLKLVMDCIWGPTAFRNEIVWRRSNAHNKLTRQYGPIHDVILFYANDRATFHPGHTPYTKAYIRDYFYHSDERGPYQSNVLTGQGVRNGESGEPWRGYDPTARGRHWAIPRSLKEELPAEQQSLGPLRLLDILDSSDEIVFSQNGVPRYKQRRGPGVLYQDIWAYQPGTKEVLHNDDAEIDRDVKWLDSETERLGYPTQKPLGLLQRIIEASTDPGDVVLDPFCGCGTAVVAAHKLNRRWAGIDISPFAIDLITKKRFPEYKIPTEGYPYDLAGARKLAREKPFKFEQWAVTRIPGFAPNDKQIGDGGIDGVGYLLARPKDTTNQVLAQVKGGRYHLGQLRDFLGVMEREQAAMGLYTTVEPIRAAGARTEATHKGFLTLGASRYPRAQLWSIHDYFNNSMPQLPALADPYTGKPLQTSLEMTLS